MGANPIVPGADRTVKEGFISNVGASIIPER